MGSCERGILSNNTTHKGSREIDCPFSMPILSLVSEMLKAIAEYAKHDRAEFVRVVQEENK